MTLDKYDSLLIRCCKSNHFDIKKLKRLFEIRCALPRGYAESWWVARHLIEIIENLKLKKMEDVIIMAAPDQLWKIGVKEQADYYDGFLYACAAILGATEVARLPGYHCSARWRNKN
jgi:hypothetical protein